MLKLAFLKFNTKIDLLGKKSKGLT
jgi:hypothetical protein